MKPISEYNFREIVGQFVLVSTTTITPEYNQYIGYCYIDMDAGISIKIYGALVNNEIKILKDKMFILRYSDDLKIKIYTDINNEMEIFAQQIDQIYTPEWITSLRADVKYDPYRDKKFPDDMLIEVATYLCRKVKFETLWIRPLQIDKDGNVFAKIIEDGEIFKKDTEVAIIYNATISNNIIAIDPYMANYILKHYGGKQ